MSLEKISSKWNGFHLQVSICAAHTSSLKRASPKNKITAQHFLRECTLLPNRRRGTCDMHCIQIHRRCSAHLQKKKKREWVGEHATSSWPLCHPADRLDTFYITVHLAPFDHPRPIAACQSFSSSRVHSEYESGTSGLSRPRKSSWAYRVY